jgi:hypothetical protein
MKIKIAIFILIIIPFNSYAEWVCLIKDKTAVILTDYIKNDRQVIKNITNEIIKNANNLDQQKINEEQLAKTSFEKKELNIKNKFKDAWLKVEREANEISSIFNEIFNFTGYHSYFKYFINYPLFNEVPFQVKRDYAILDNENKGLIEYIKKLDQNWTNKIIIKNACKWIIKWLEWCKILLNWKNTKEIIWKLIKNNSLILDLYRTTVMWEQNNITNDQLILVDNNFILNLNKYYWTKSVSACNSEEKWFFKQISEAISNINLMNKQAKDWIQKWKDSYALLIWNKPDEENKIEQKKFKEYLDNKWIPSDKQAILNKNLKEYNSKGFSLNNNFIENSYNYTIWKFKKDLNLWKKENIWESVKKWTKQINLNQLKKIENNSIITRKIQYRITELYQNEIPFTAASDIHTENLRAKIINSHLNLQDSINLLEKTIKISQKVCNSQWWWWNCN